MVRVRQHRSQAPCPHRNTTFRLRSMQIGQQFTSSISAILPSKYFTRSALFWRVLLETTRPSETKRRPSKINNTYRGSVCDRETHFSPFSPRVIRFVMTLRHSMHFFILELHSSHAILWSQGFKITLWSDNSEQIKHSTWARATFSEPISAFAVLQLAFVVAFSALLSRGWLVESDAFGSALKPNRVNNEHNT